MMIFPTSQLALPASEDLSISLHVLMDIPAKLLMSGQLASQCGYFIMKKCLSQDKQNSKETQVQKTSS